jgi:CubicO group peptidase (beta-lactamase class C family)
MVALMAYASMAATKASTALPDMTTTLREQRVESASVAVIRDGQIVSTGAWGMAGPNRAATVSTPYNLASLTKPLTAEVILRLAAAGKLSLEEPMDRYWSDPDLSRDPRRMKLTVRMALSHRTGLPNWRDAKGLAFDHDPDTTTGYSGEGYQYAARYAEHRTGQSFETLARRWLFAPAHMRASGYVSAQGETVPIAVPYDDAGKQLPVERVTRYNAADLAHATARDYARFLIDRGAQRPGAGRDHSGRAQQIAGRPDRPKSVPDRKRRPVRPGLASDWAGSSSALRDGTTMLHTGKDAGAFTFAAIDRARGDGIVILTNSDNGWRVILPILERTGSDPKLIAFLRGQMS